MSFVTCEQSPLPCQQPARPRRTLPSPRPLRRAPARSARRPAPAVWPSLASQESASGPCVARGVRLLSRGVLANAFEVRPRGCAGRRPVGAREGAERSAQALARGRRGRARSGAVVNHEAVSIHGQVLSWTCVSISLGKTPRSEIVGSSGKFNVYGTLTFNYIRNFKNCFSNHFPSPPTAFEGSNSQLSVLANMWYFNLC